MLRCRARTPARATRPFATARGRHSTRAVSSPDSDFQQQRLKAWQPLLTPKWVIGTFLLIGAIFIPIGIVIVVYSNRVTELEVRYDNYRATADSTFPSSCPVSPSPCIGDATNCRINNIDFEVDYTGSPTPATVDACSVTIPITIPNVSTSCDGMKNGCGAGRG